MPRGYTLSLMPESHLDKADRLITYVRGNDVRTVDLKHDRWTSWNVDVYVNTKFVMKVSNVAVDIAQQQLRNFNVVFNNI